MAVVCSPRATRPRPHFSWKPISLVLSSAILSGSCRVCERGRQHWGGHAAAWDGGSHLPPPPLQPQLWRRGALCSRWCENSLSRSPPWPGAEMGIKCKSLELCLMHYSFSLQHSSFPSPMLPLGGRCKCYSAQGLLWNKKTQQRALGLSQVAFVKPSSTFPQTSWSPAQCQPFWAANLLCCK